MADEKKNNIKVAVKDEPKSDASAGAKVRAEAKAKADVKEESVKPGELISTNDHPVAVKYGDEVIMVSPRSRLKILDAGKLPSQLPHGLHLKLAK